MADEDYFYKCTNHSPSSPPNITEGEAEEYQCYTVLRGQLLKDFYHYEDQVACGVLIVSFFGIIGNLMNLVVLSHKDMRSNCFNQLLMGE